MEAANLCSCVDVYQGQTIPCNAVLPSIDVEFCSRHQALKAAWDMPLPAQGQPIFGTCRFYVRRLKKVCGRLCLKKGDMCDIHKRLGQHLGTHA